MPRSFRDFSEAQICLAFQNVPYGRVSIGRSQLDRQAGVSSDSYPDCPVRGNRRRKRTGRDAQFANFKAFGERDRTVELCEGVEKVPAVFDKDPAKDGWLNLTGPFKELHSQVAFKRLERPR